MVNRFWSRKRSDRFRAIGWLVLAFGLAVAVVFYFLEAQTADPVLNDTTALGYQRSLRHGMGVMMGHFGILLTEWSDAATSPLGEALLIAAGAALIAGYFFRVAWVLDADQHD